VPPRRPSLALYGEALIALVVARLLIRLLSFARLMRMIRTSIRTLETPASAELARDLADVLDAWSRRLPWRSKCFEQGMAALWMLSRRGLSATLYYGAAIRTDTLSAHVWVRSGERDVVGCENASDFAVLSRFSNDSSSSPVQP